MVTPQNVKFTVDRSNPNDSNTTEEGGSYALDLQATDHSLKDGARNAVH